MRYATITDSGFELRQASSIPAGSIELTVEQYQALSSGTHTLQDGAIVPVVAEPAPVVYAAITPRQIRQALTLTGLRTEVETAVAAGDQNLKDWWEFSTAFERNHPEVIAMATALGVPSSSLDALWTLGASL